MRRALVLALLLVAGAAAPADAGIVVATSPLLGERVGARTAPARVEGELLVSFTADPATCAAHGRCGERGTIAYRPGRVGTLYVLELRRGRRTVLHPLLVGGFSEGGDVVAQVRRPRAGGGTGVCGDSTRAAVELLTARVSGPVTAGFAPGGPGPLTTRCGGPLWADLARFMPQPRLGQAAIARGFTADLRGGGSFTAGGLTGTVRSTLVLRTGRPAPVDEGENPDEAPELGELARWRVASARGSVRVEQRDLTTGPACGVFDSCGLVATMALTPRPTAAGNELITGGEGRELGGGGGWTDAGTVATTVTRDGAVAPCTDTAPLLGGVLTLGAVGGRIGVEYSTLPSTRCGGIELDPFTTVGVGFVPRAALRGRRFTVRLQAAPSRTTRGLRTTVASDLVLELVRR